MKSLLDLHNIVTQSLGRECSVMTDRDIKTVAARSNSEGMSFLTISLPSYRKDFESSLDEGRVAPTRFLGFKKRAGLPSLYSGFLEQIFDRNSGVILDTPSISAIRAVRQITGLLGKVELECTDDRISSAYDKYVQCELELRAVDAVLSQKERAEFKRVASVLFRDMFTVVDAEVASYNLEPRHGSGATQEKVLGNHKFLQRTWTERLESCFPYWRYATHRAFSKEKYDEVVVYEPGAEPPSRLTHVPKTLSTPRLIAIEPVHMQYAQQGLLRSLVSTLKQFPLLHGMIGTESQLPNQELARLSSRDGTLATLDLSEASDRVLNSLVIDLFADAPHLGDAVQASRSLQADVPGYGALPLTKFASMGSALCFPVETYVFLTLTVLGLQDAYNTKFTKLGQLKPYLGVVRLYGDDIIVPVEAVSAVSSRLEAFGLKVNTSKSFWTGKFRESCGSEWYDGHDVSYVKVRNVLPNSSADVDELVSLVDFRNQAYWRGMWGCINEIDAFIKKLIPFPAVSSTSSALGKESVLGYETQRICPKLQRPMVKGIVVSETPRVTEISDDAALMKFFTYVEKDSLDKLGFVKKSRPTRPKAGSEDRMIYGGRPLASNTNKRWAYSY